LAEKRAHPRFCLWFPVVVEASTGAVAAVCNDASAGGVGIFSAGPLAVGAIVTVTFRVEPEDKERTARGRVVRMEPRTENPREIWSHRLAIEFLEPQPHLQHVFRRSSSRPPPGL
jgi:hypothetical protein